MKSFLIIGLGRFGRHITETLFEQGNEVFAVDQQASRIQAVLPLVTNAMIGDSTDPDFLKSVGPANFDVCIVAIGDNFQSSLETTSLLKDFGAPLVVSRASQDRQAKLLLHNGADEIVYPEKQLARWTAIRYSANHILDYIELDEDYGIFEINPPQEWIGKTIGDLNIRRKYKITIMAIRRGDTLNMTITPETVFAADESILILGRNRDVQRHF